MHMLDALEKLAVDKAKEKEKVDKLCDAVCDILNSMGPDDMAFPECWRNLQEAADSLELNYGQKRKK